MLCWQEGGCAHDVLQELDTQVLQVGVVLEVLGVQVRTKEHQSVRLCHYQGEKTQTPQLCRWS